MEIGRLDLTDCHQPQGSNLVHYACRGQIGLVRCFLLVFSPSKHERVVCVTDDRAAGGEGRPEDMIICEVPQ